MPVLAAFISFLLTVIGVQRHSSPEHNSLKCQNL